MTASVRWITYFVLLPSVACLVLSCGAAKGPQQRLEDTLQRMRDSAVTGQVGDFMERVAEDFSGQNGNLDRRGLNSLLRVQLLKHSRVTASIMSDEYKMFEGRASVELSVLMTGGPGNWLPDSGRVYKIRTGWREQDGQWSMISAVWE